MPETKESLLAQKEALELELLREQVETMRANRQRKQLSHAQVENELEIGKRNQRNREANCTHRKGGMGLEGVHGKGNDPQYAVVKHQLPLGDWFIVCQRCGKEWRKSDPDNGGKPTKGYDDALAFPTDNQPSGSSLFTVTQAA